MFFPLVKVLAALVAGTSIQSAVQAGRRDVLGASTGMQMDEALKHLALSGGRCRKDAGIENQAQCQFDASASMTLLASMPHGSITYYVSTITYRF